MAATPTDIGKYQVERELGRGASGAVYLARDTFRDNWVAIKQIHPHLMVDPAQANKYRRLFAQRGRLGRPDQPPAHRVAD